MIFIPGQRRSGVIKRPSVFILSLPKPRFMSFQKPTSADFEYFRSVIGEENVLVDEESLHHYSHDETEDLRFLPEVILKPRTAGEISSILRYCNDKKICVTPRAAGTGLSGGALPVLGGVI